METEQPLNLDNVEIQADEKLKVKNRFEKLSEKVIVTSKEKDDALAKAKAESERADLAQKEATFYKGFSANVTKYPQASQFQDKILEKVRSGYDVEDAMIAVLAKEGKLSSATPVQQFQNVQVEGGSALNSPEGIKSIHEMTTAEKFAALEERDKSGDLARSLTGR